MKRFIVVISTVLFFSCNNVPDKVVEPVTEAPATGIAAPANIQASLIAEYPHDTGAFTEGLFIHDGKLYEGTGEVTKSAIQITDIKTGKLEKKYPIADPTIFGEGINILNGKLYQLTYQNHKAFMYDLKDLSKPIKTFDWATEGWGMTNNGTELIISDGSKQGNLYFVSPEDFKVKRVMQVVDNMGPVDSINELEYIDGFIYANVWGTSYLVKIDASNGHVVGKIETATPLNSFYSGYTIHELDNVLNGIAYDSTTKKIYITGKRWPKLFEIRLN
jgi:glutaminyl-peptide cyclotransferase